MVLNRPRWLGALTTCLLLLQSWLLYRTHTQSASSFAFPISRHPALALVYVCPLLAACLGALLLLPWGGGSHFSRRIKSRSQLVQRVWWISFATALAILVAIVGGTDALSIFRGRIPLDTGLRHFSSLKQEQEDPCADGRERCVIAFGVYGNDPFYLDGCQRNIELAKKYYPGWRVRFYTDDAGSLPKAYVSKLQTATSEVIRVSNVQGEIAGMFWRFLVAFDDSVDRYIVRDIDSALGSRERAAVAEWTSSGRQFHLFRDAPAHTGWPVMGGCWGGVKGALPKSVGDIIINGGAKSFMAAKGGDQDFLELYVWPYMEASASLLAHDSYHCSSYPHTTAFPTRRKGPWDMAARIIDVGNDAEEKGLDAAWVPSASQQCPALCRPPDHQDWLAC